MNRPLVVLFDIDETLVHTGGSGARSWAWAFDQLHGVPADIGAHTSAGETDPQVGRATFRAVLHRDPSHDEMARLYAKYLWHLAEDIWTAQGYRVLDGAEDLLRRLGEAGVMLGVISGPWKAPRSPDRTEVTKLAIAKAGRLHGRDLAVDEVYVVGDTPLDITSAHAAGATAIGVASGHYDAGQLRAAHPEHVLGSLTEPFPGLATTPSSSNDS